MKNLMSIACHAARYSHFIAANRPFARTKGFVRGLVPCLLVLGWLLACPSVVHALTNSSAMAFYGDDIHTSILAPLNYVTSQTPWVNSALSNWVAKASTPGWNFNWDPSGPNNMTVLSDVGVSNYYAWVVYQGGVPLPRGITTGVLGPKEIGGAVIGLGFKPTVGGLNPDPLADVKVHWLQAFQSVLRGVTNNGVVDNNGTNTTPFYDGVTDAAGTNYFVDVPAITENEYEANPIASVTFQLFLATDSFDQTGTAPHNVTIYAGLSWGYTYSAADYVELPMFSSPNGRNVILNVPQTDSGRPYFIFQTTTNLKEGSWTWTPYTNFTGTGSNKTFSVPATNSQQWFKLVGGSG
jgi:hypothetical protein